MRNAALTKEHLLTIAGNLFNTQGYKATSLSDITFASGYTKGAIYKHFINKAVLEREALEHMTAKIVHCLRDKIRAESNVMDKLKATFLFYTEYVTNPIIPGGCPILNAAIEADDTRPELRQVAKKALDIFHQSIVKLLDNGIKFNQLKKNINKEDFATLIISSFEGAIMMSKLTGDTNYLKQVFKHLENQLLSYKK